MLQTNSIFNFFNRTELMYKEINSNNIIIKSNAINLNIFLFANTYKRWDNLNLHYTGFYLKSKNKLKLTLKIFINCFIFQ